MEGELLLDVLAALSLLRTEPRFSLYMLYRSRAALDNAEKGKISKLFSESIPDSTAVEAIVQ
jgi:ethanolamine ammonia-lyase small subunit